jgi:phosphoadenosine phosphosulfate reductase
LVACAASHPDPYARWESANVVVGVAMGTLSAVAHARLGDITSAQLRALASILRDFGADRQRELDLRVTNRQNLALRGLAAEQLPDLYARLDAIGMAAPGAELARDVVSCPGADTCNPAVTQPRPGRRHALRACLPRLRRRRRSASSAATRRSAPPARPSPPGWSAPEGPRPSEPASPTSTCCPTPKSTRSTMSTSPRRGRTWPRSDEESAQEMTSVEQAWTDERLADLDAGFEHQPPAAVISWAVEQFHPHLCLTASMNDAVLIDMAVAVEPAVEVVFIDTGYHFPETLETLEAVRRRYRLNLRVMTVPPQPVPLWKIDPERCCSSAKVEQLDRALAGNRAWMSGLRRVEAATRADAPIVARDRRGLVKVNPLATWSDLDVAGYIADHDVPVHPLLSRGYPSIGCAPCTVAVPAGAHPRAGRWAGSEKTECGLHDAWG